MSQTVFDAFPAARREAARAALAEALGRTAPTSIAPVTGGASGALIYRVLAGERPYLLRLEPPPSPLRDINRAHACLRAAAEAGLAPRVHLADPAAGVAIMDFVIQQPLAAYPGGPAGLARALGELTARLQATPVFPPLADYPALLERMLVFLKGSGLFAPGLLDPHLEGLARVQEAYGWDAAGLVSSHNDPNPGNVLFDGERLWLVDWETAFRNDPLTDVAIMTSNFTPTPDLENVLIEAWLGRAPDARLRARLLLMRLLTRLYYAGVIFSMFAMAPRVAPVTDLTAPDPDAFRALADAGRLVAGAPDTMFALGKICLAGFVDGLATPAAQEAMVVARQG